MVQFWERRHMHALAARVPKLVLFSNSFLYVLYCAVCLNNVFMADYPCLVIYWQSVLCLGGSGVVYILRCVRLLFDYEITLARVQRERRRKSQSLRRSTSLRRLKVEPTVVEEPEELRESAESHDSQSGAEDEQEQPEAQQPEPIRQGDTKPARSNSQPRFRIRRVLSLHTAALKSSFPEQARDTTVSVSLTRDPTIVPGVTLDEAEERARWYFEHRHWVTREGLVKLFVYIMATLVTVGMVVRLIFPSPTKDRGECSDGKGRVYYIGIVMVEMAIFLYFAYRLRPLIDAFFIKAELRFTAFAVSFGVVVWYLLLFPLELKSFPLHSIVTLLLIIVAVATSLIWPLLRTYSESGAPVLGPELQAEAADGTESDSVSVLPIDAVLRDSTGHSLFYEHLTREFSVENIVFWDRVEEYRAEVEATLADASLSPDEQQERAFARAFSIYCDCVREGSAYEINLPYAVREPLKHLFEPHLSVATSASRPPHLSRPNSFTPSQPRLRSVTEGNEPTARAEQSSDSDDAAEDTKSRTASDTRANLRGSQSTSSGSAGSGIELAHLRKLSANSSSYSPSGDFMEDAFPTPPDLFDAAQAVITDLMNRDSYRRFIATTQFLELQERQRNQRRRSNKHQDPAKFSTLNPL